MTFRVLWAGALALVVGCAGASANAQAPAGDALPAPQFHHVHLNSPNPPAAIAEYLKALPSNTRTTVAGFDGFKTTNNIYFLFNKVATPPSAAIPDKITAKTPQNSFWHFVFPVKNLRTTLAQYHKEIPNFSSRILPLYTETNGKTVEMGGDAMPGFITDKQIAELRAKGVKPTGDGGYITWIGPDGAIMENSQGPDQKLTIFGLFQEQPFCAQLWYQKHLNTPIPAGPGGNAAPARTEANCKVTLGTEPSWPSTYKRGHFRSPPAMGVNFSDVFVRWYMNQESTPLAPMRGGVVDHFGLSVANLDPWIAKLQSENVKFLQGPTPYRVGDMRAVMIEGPSREAIELVEVK